MTPEARAKDIVVSFSGKTFSGDVESDERWLERRIAAAIRAAEDAMVDRCARIAADVECIVSGDRHISFISGWDAACDAAYDDILALKSTAEVTND